MKIQAIVLAALATAPAALAHTVWSVLYVDGVSQGDGAGMRMRTDPKLASYPLQDYSSDDMACNVDGEKGVDFVSSVKDGSTLTFEMRSWPSDPSKQPLDRPHYGPCAVYMKKVSSAVKDKGAGDGWFKLMDDGYHADTDKWCTDRLIDNKGRLSVELPKGLEGGYYLARPEVVALHNASEGAAQFYTGCAQIFLESTGSLVPESTIAIPGPEYVTAGQSSVHFNIYIGKNAEYQVPGPAVANFTSKSSTAAAGVQTKQTEGLIPGDCIAQNANWCGKEVPSYSDETGCWASGEDCWTQGKACYDQAPPTGSKVCGIWQTKCQAINDACTAKNFKGPPNKDKVLTPKAVTIDIGLVIPVIGGGNIDSAASTAPKSSEAAQEPSAPTPKSSAPASEPSTSTTAAHSAAPAASSKATPAPSSDVSPSLSLSTLPILSFTQGQYVPVASSVITVPVSESSPATTPATTPAPTSAPVKGKCPKGYHCVTDYKVKVVTETRYVTVSADGPGYNVA